MKSFLNSFLEQNKATHEESVGALASRMHVRANELAVALDRACSDAVTATPRLIQDIEFVHKDVQLLKASFAVLSDSQSSATTSNTAFDQLLLMHTVRARMLEARKALQEAENWNSLSAELEPLLQSSDFSAAAARLSEASRSLVLLHGTSEYEDRRALLHSLQTQLEQSITPFLVSALSAHNLVEIMKIHDVFLQIQRTSEFQSVFFKTIKTPMLAAWLKIRGNRDMTKGSNFVEALDEFLNELFIVLKNEFSWSGQVFQNNLHNLIKLIHQIFNSLNPSLRVLLDRLKKADERKFVVYFANSYQLIVAWIALIEREVVPLAVKSGSPKEMTPPVTQTVAKKVSSGHLASANNSTVSASTQKSIDFKSWSHPILESFSGFQQTYGIDELTHLTSSLSMYFKSSKPLSSMTLVNQLAATLDALVESVIPNVIRAVKTATERGILVSAGFAGQSLVEPLDVVFVQTVRKIEELLPKLVSFSSQGTVSAGIEESNTLLEIVEFISERQSDGSGEDDVESYEYVPNVEDGIEWVGFELGLRYLSALKSMHDNVKSFEGELIKILRAVSIKMIAVSRMDLSTTTEIPKVEPADDEIEIQAFQSVSSIALLQSSPLNSQKLQSFYQAVEAEFPKLSEYTNYCKIQVLNHSNETLLFPKAIKAINGAVAKAQLSVFEMVFSSITRHISTIPSFSVWSLENESMGGGNSRSISPSTFIARVGELILTLPQRFYMHIGDSIEDSAIEFSVRGLTHLVSADFNVPSDSELSEEQLSQELDREEFINFWIIAVCRATMSSFLTSVLAIPRLGKFGAAQLLTDLKYIIKVLDEVDVQASEELVQVGRALEMSADELRDWVKKDGCSESVIKIAKVCGYLV